MIKFERYNLPDAMLLDKNNKVPAMITWVPDRSMAVIGHGSKMEEELNLDAIKDQNIPVYKRPTGGCSVVLTPRMLAVSFAVYSEEQMKSKKYLDYFNNVLLRALQNLDIRGLHPAGISDIAINNKKIIGSALYRNVHMIFYHAILNISEKPKTIENFLATPPRMPGYRQGRPHSEFVTSLADSGWDLKPEVIEKSIKVEWHRAIADVSYISYGATAAHHN